MNVGKNTVEHWNEKHKREYDIYEPYDFTQIDKSPLSYHKVASDIIFENKNEFKNKSMLEIGCAGGYFSSYVKRYIIPDWKIRGWDFSQAGIDSAVEKNKDLKDIQFDVVDILKTPIQDDYGLITCFETIEHIEEGTNYKLLNNWLDHCEYMILSTVDTEDDCRGEHISHYKIDTFEKKGYSVLWEEFLAPIHMPNGIYHYIIFLIKGKLK